MQRITCLRAELEVFLKKIEMSVSYSDVILKAFDEWAKEMLIEEKSERIFDREYIRQLINSLSGMEQAKMIMLFLVLALEEKTDGVWTRFPEEIFIATMSDFSAFVRFYRDATGEEGYGKGSWPIHYVNARIFRLGAFEFELIEEQEKKRIEMHIPEKTSLCLDTLKDSIKRKNSFLRQFFPEWVDVRVECGSWMLSPALQELLPSDSRILWFQTMFDMFDIEKDNDFYLQFVFGLEYFQWFKGYDFAKLKEETTLQRKMKEYVINGGKPGIGWGYLMEENI